MKERKKMDNNKIAHQLWRLSSRPGFLMIYGAHFTWYNQLQIQATSRCITNINHSRGNWRRIRSKKAYWGRWAWPRQATWLISSSDFLDRQLPSNSSFKCPKTGRYQNWTLWQTQTHRIDSNCARLSIWWASKTWKLPPSRKPKLKCDLQKKKENASLGLWMQRI